MRNKGSFSDDGRDAFTYMEIMIVVFVIAGLAAMSGPKYFTVIERSKASEALSAIDVVKRSIERCASLQGNSYAGCGNFAALDVDDPGNAPGAHFQYTITQAPPNPNYRIRAIKNGEDINNPTNYFQYQDDAGGITTFGAGLYVNMF